MTLSGKITKSFNRHWGERTASGAARKALETFIPGAPRSTVPVNVEVAAKFLGIEQVVEDDLVDSDGLLNSTAGGKYLVTLKRGQSRLRKRFTLAHEIGHVVIYKSIGRGEGAQGAESLGCRAETIEDIEEERLCDVVASELLMPREQFLRDMKDRGVSAYSIPMIARQYDVSLQAASRRVASVLGYDIGVGFWALSEAASHLVPRWYLTKKGSMALPYAVDVKQPAAALFADEPVRGWHWLPLQGQMDKYFIDIQPLSSPARSWLLVVVFGDTAHHIMTEISKARLLPPIGQLPLIDE